MDIYLQTNRQTSSLNPLKNNSTRFLNLTIKKDNQEFSYNTPWKPGDKLNFGNLATGSFDSIYISSSTINGVLTGYGKLEKDFKLLEDQPVSLTVPFRYPFTYLTGSSNLEIFHPFLETGVTTNPIQLGNFNYNSSGVALSNDGIMLLASAYSEVESTAKIFGIETIDHSKIIEINLESAHPFTNISISPDDQMAALYNPEGNKIIFVNLPDFFNQDVQAYTAIEFANPTSVVFANKNRAYVLSSTGYSHSTCNQQNTSSITGIDLPSDLNSSSTPETFTVINNSNYIASMLLWNNQQSLLMANPCEHEITITPISEPQVSTFLNATNLSPCLVPVHLVKNKKHLLTSCQTRADTIGNEWAPAKLIIQRFDLDSPSHSASSPIILNYPREAFLYDANMPDGSYLQLLQETEKVLPLAINLSVKNNKIIILAEAYYHSQPISISGGSLSELKRKSYSLIFLNPDSASISRRYRVACYPVEDEFDPSLPEEGLKNIYCAEMENVEIPPVSFIPVDISSLYGVK
ncbi:MAG: hypothetical protein ACQES9_10550 [Myxococcota bacterium]